MASLLFPRQTLVAPLRSRSYLSRRNAQTARRPIPDDRPDMPESSSAAARREAEAQAEKHRERHFAATYRFPIKGERGGPPDPFEVLGVTRSSSNRQVTEAFHQRVKLVHPDHNHPESSQERFQMLNTARNILLKPHSRAAYLQSGLGWSRNEPLDPRSDPDYKMRQEVMARARVRRAFSEAGGGAWGGFEGNKWKPHQDTGFNMDFSAEPTYMSNPKFLSSLAVVAAVLAWLQYHRIEMVTDTRKEMLDQAHLSASHALASARGEASMHGDRRRDMIRRKVVEARVLREVENMENNPGASMDR